jgi:hypothetical protein
MLDATSVQATVYGIGAAAGDACSGEAIGMMTAPFHGTA